MSLQKDWDDPGEIKNNNSALFMPDGDSNANQIQVADGSEMGDAGAPVPPLVFQHDDDNGGKDRIVIWGTDSRCDDPELAEFEMLECQELEAYLVKEEEREVDGAAHAEGGMSPGETHLPRGCTAASATMGKQADCSEAGGKGLQQSAQDQGCPSRAGFSSENDLFAPCLQALDCALVPTLFPAGSLKAQRSQTPEDTLCASCGHKTRSGHVDLNLNSTEILQDCGPKARPELLDQRESTLGKITTITGKCTENGELDLCPNREYHQTTEREHNGSILGQCDDWNSETQKKIKEKVCCSQPSLNGLASSQGCLAGAEVPPSTLSPPEAGSHTVGPKAGVGRSRDHGTSAGSSNTPRAGSGAVLLRKPGSFEHSPERKALLARRPWGSPTRPATPPSPLGSPRRRRPPVSPAKKTDAALPHDYASAAPKPPCKTCPGSGIPKPVAPQPLARQAEVQESRAPRSPPPPHCASKPKNVRPKIITSIRKAPQERPHPPDNPYQVSTLPSRFTPYAASPPPSREQPKAGAHAKVTAVLSASNLLYNKNRHEVEKASCCTPGLVVSGIRPPTHTAPHKLTRKSESFYGEQTNKYLHEKGRGGAGPGCVDSSPSRPTQHPTSALICSPRALRPQLGLGSVTRLPSARNRILLTGQRPALTFAYPARAASPPSAYYQENSVDQRRPSSEAQQTAQSGLRLPGYSRLPAARFSTFGFVRSTSMASVTSGLSGECPLACRKEIQKHVEVARPPDSSPKRFRVGSPKPHSPVHVRQRSEFVRLQECCETQAGQLCSLQAELRRATLGLEAFAVATQHFCQKSERGVVKERALSLELARIRDEVALSATRWERLQRDGEERERRFERELWVLREQQKAELEALGERLRVGHKAERDRILQEQRAELNRLHAQQQRQTEEMIANHKAATAEAGHMHSVTMATLRDEHERTVNDLMVAHKEQRRLLEQDFEKIRLSLQDEVDTLTFQNRSLRDRAKRFEDALRRSTDEQIVDALAPYQHIKEDLKSLKEVLEMKNQQIHEQEKKITELERMAQKKIILEERVQVLQQQNEDLKARIDRNLAMSRQLSEENANLQVHVEKESEEKKRLSRNNEELLWRLQTGELSPQVSPSSSPLRRLPPGSASPSRLHPFPR